jgi:death-on-curing protein
VAAPQASFGGKPLIQDPIEMAAAYLFYLCRNHPFVDGNKRTALAAALVFLDANGLLADPGVPTRAIDDWESLALDVASSKLDREQTARRLRGLLKR